MAVDMQKRDAQDDVQRSLNRNLIFFPSEVPNPVAIDEVDTEVDLGGDANGP